MTTIQDDPSSKPSPDVLMLDSAGPTATGFGLKMHAGGPETAETLLFIADSMRSMLDEHDAPNYLEMELQASDSKQYIMTLQRKGHVTPHQARVAAEEALAAATAAPGLPGAVLDHINQRSEYVTAARNSGGDVADYYRWQGHMEARRQLAEKLGYTVPYEIGDKAEPKAATE